MQAELKYQNCLVCYVLNTFCLLFVKAPLRMTLVITVVSLWTTAHVSTMATYTHQESHTHKLVKHGELFVTDHMIQEHTHANTAVILSQCVRGWILELHGSGMSRNLLCCGRVSHHHLRWKKIYF